jgi:putative CocE/NonD family hydrolase
MKIILISVWILCLAAPAAVPANTPVEKTVSTTMEDGVRLEATVVLPAAGGPYPAILIRTPYGKHQHMKEARYWASNGYAVMVQDTRGKFGSNGEYIPFLNEFDDGWATLDWIAAQEWSNGRVGMYGSSYLAFCQLVLASRGHPALKSIIPVSGWIQDDGQIEHGGAHHIMLSLPWILHEESQTKRSIVDYDLEEMFEYLPLFDVFKSIGLDSRIWNEEFDFSHLDAYSAAEIAIPALHITGWNDFVHGAALRVYEQTVAGPAGRHQKLLVGPWFHDQWYTTFTECGDEDFGPESAMGIDRLMKLALGWFDKTLKSESADVSGWPDVELFVMGENEWRRYESWPPPVVRHRDFFLGSSTGANSAAGDGRLTAAPPSGQGFDTFLFDPMNPVPTHGGANFHFMLHLVGVKDQRDIEEREDVLVYTSDPLEEELEIVGPVKAVVHVSSEGRDTDFTAKLVQVRPDGYARIIEEGIQRVSFRNGPDKRELIEPGRVYEITIDMGSTAITIPPGHRLRLEVSSSNFPKYDRNPNTGEDPLQARVLKPVTQKVYFGGDYRSHLVLPVVERLDVGTLRRN